MPINALGRGYTEHRFYEMAQLTQKEGKFYIIHRFMLEQRFIGRYSSPAKMHEDEIHIGFGKNVGANTFDQQPQYFPKQQWDYCEREF